MLEKAMEEAREGVIPGVYDAEKRSGMEKELRKDLEKSKGVCK